MSRSDRVAFHHFASERLSVPTASVIQTIAPERLLADLKIGDSYAVERRASRRVMTLSSPNLEIQAAAPGIVKPLSFKSVTRPSAWAAVRAISGGRTVAQPGSCVKYPMAVLSAGIIGILLKESRISARLFC